MFAMGRSGKLLSVEQPDLGPNARSGRGEGRFRVDFRHQHQAAKRMPPSPTVSGRSGLRLEVESGHRLSALAQPTPFADVDLIHSRGIVRVAASLLALLREVSDTNSRMASSSPAVVNGL